MEKKVKETKKRYHYHIPALIAVFALLFAGVFIIGAYLGNDNTGLFTLVNTPINADINTQKIIPVVNYQYPGTVSKTINYKIAGEVGTTKIRNIIQYFTEYVGGNVSELKSTIPKSNLKYTVEFMSGIDFNKNSNLFQQGTSISWVDSGVNDNITINLFGKDYSLNKVNWKNNTIYSLELLENSSFLQYKINHKIEPLKGKDGKAYYVIVSGVTSNNEAIMNLYDENTNLLVPNYIGLKLKINDLFAEDILETPLLLTNILNLGTQDIPDWITTFNISKKIILQEGTIYPYDNGTLKIYKVGDKLDLLKGKDDKTYYAYIIGVNSNNEVIMSLYDENTNTLILDYTNKKISINQTFAEDILDTTIYVKEILNLGRADAPNYSIKLLITPKTYWVVDSITETNKTNLKSIVFKSNADFNSTIILN